MSISKKISEISVHVLVLILTVTLVTGLAGLGYDVSATTSGPSPFGNTKSSYQHNGRFDGSLIVNGVDVSYFQATGSNWKTAKKKGCDYAIMRVTYTTYGNGSLNLDTKFATHFKKAKAAGVMKGIYVFSQAKNATEAKKEARYALKRLKALGITPADVELPVYMDYEFAGKSYGWNRGRLYGLTRSKAIKSVNAFCDVIRAAGYDPGVYANTSFFNKYLANGQGLADDIDLWCAQYYIRNESPCNYTKWQYTSTAKVSGIKFYSTNKIGSCDADFWYLNKKVNKSAKGDIYGNTNLKYTGSAVLPTLDVYYGKTLLKEGTDYIIGGINNRNNGSDNAYAYVKGIGKYGGYALVPLKISKKFINHIGLASVGSKVITNVKNGTYKIGTSDAGSYVRNVPAGTTAKTLIKKLKLKNDNYTIAVINEYGEKVDKTKAVTTGMMVGVFKGSELKGTADITVNGKTINDTGANYLAKADRSAKTVVSDVTTTATVSDGTLDVDGSGGPDTLKALQKFLGVKQTGTVIIPKKFRKYVDSIASPKSGTKDTNTVTAMQKWLGVKTSGKWGKKTSKALQEKVGAAVDGYFGKKSMKALQKYLNINKKK